MIIDCFDDQLSVFESMIFLVGKLGNPRRELVAIFATDQILDVSGFLNLGKIPRERTGVFVVQTHNSLQKFSLVGIFKELINPIIFHRLSSKENGFIVCQSSGEMLVAALAGHGRGINPSPNLFGSNLEISFSVRAKPRVTA